VFSESRINDLSPPPYQPADCTFRVFGTPLPDGDQQIATVRSSAQVGMGERTDAKANRTTTHRLGR
jgi:hypothetical protein